MITTFLEAISSLQSLQFLLGIRLSNLIRKMVILKAASLPN
jgi:hypothetical protein